MGCGGNEYLIAMFDLQYQVQEIELRIVNCKFSTNVNFKLDTLRGSLDS